MSTKKVLHYNFIVIQYCSNVLFMIYQQKFLQTDKGEFCYDRTNDMAAARHDHLSDPDGGDRCDLFEKEQ